MASLTGKIESPIYAMRDTMNLPARIQEAQVLGPAGAKTELIQKLALTAQPSRRQLSIMRHDPAERAGAKEKTRFAVMRSSEPVKPQKQEITTKTEAVYRDTKGFAAVA